MPLQPHPHITPQAHPTTTHGDTCPATHPLPTLWCKLMQWLNHFRAEGPVLLPKVKDLDHSWLQGRRDTSHTQVTFFTAVHISLPTCVRMHIQAYVRMILVQVEAPRPLVPSFAISELTSNQFDTHPPQKHTYVCR